jgi:uncharacterized membrane protein YcaP (DUF421 family)
MQRPEQLLNLDPISLALVVVRTVVVYAVLLLVLRLAGKRELGQMTPFDLVVLLIISNAVQNAMVGPDTSLNGGLLAALTLVVVNRLVDRLGLRSAWLQHHLIGEPTLLVHDGALLADHLRREGISQDEVLQALREHGVDDLAAVKLAVLEADGTISVIPTDAPSSRPADGFADGSHPAKPTARDQHHETPPEPQAVGEDESCLSSVASVPSLTSPSALSSSCSFGSRRMVNFTMTKARAIRTVLGRTGRTSAARHTRTSKAVALQPIDRGETPDHQTARIHRAARPVISVVGRLDLEGGVLDPELLTQDHPGIVEHVGGGPAAGCDVAAHGDEPTGDGPDVQVVHRVDPGDCAQGALDLVQIDRGGRCLE